MRWFDILILVMSYMSVCHLFTGWCVLMWNNRKGTFTHYIGNALINRPMWKVPLVGYVWFIAVPLAWYRWRQP